MDSPVFKLERVVHSRTEERQDFEGPLDLILFLLGKNKMEIQDISISQICGQYLAWLDRRQQLDMEVASEFVAMASHLVYLKTRMLLSIEDEEARKELEALRQSLKERQGESYAYFKAMGERLAPMGEFGRSICVRGPESLEPGKAEYDHCPQDLIRAMWELQSRAERKLPPSKAAQGVGYIAASASKGNYPFSPAFQGKPEPQRGGSDFFGGAGAMPVSCPAIKRLSVGMHGSPSGGASR